MNWIFLNVLFFIVPTAGFAGSLNDTGAPTSSASAMYTLDDIYNRLNSNTQATKRSGAFTEPSAGPGSTGHTLDQVYEKAIPTQVPKTGQTKCYDASGTEIDCTNTGQDGDLRKGVARPNPRFTDNNNGTVTDNLTGLIWLKNASCGGEMTWANALTWSKGLHDGCTTCGGTNGDCGLSDSSVAGNWRLPNIMELLSLIDWGYYDPTLSNAAGTAKWTDGDPFTGVQSSGGYWSATTYLSNTTFAQQLYLVDGFIGYDSKAFTIYVWPVRDGH